MKRMMTVAAGALSLAASLGAVRADGLQLVKEDFAKPLDANWRLPEKWRVADGVGYGWSKALVYENDDPQWYAFTTVTMPGLRPLMKAEASFKVKVDPGFKGDVGAVFEWDDANGKYAGGAGGLVKKFKDLVPDTQGFVVLRVKPTEIPSVAVSTHLSVYVSRGSTGKVVFDDFDVHLTEVRRVGRVFANGYRGEVARGDAKVSVGLQCGDLKDRPTATFAYLGADGRRHEVAPTQMDETMARLVLPVERLALGRQTIGFTLKDASGGELGTASVALTRTAEPTPRKVRFDEHNRTIVDGKPFFPIAMFWTNGPFKNKGALEAYGKGPFNSLQCYNMRLTREELDAWWTYGLRVIPSFSSCYAPTESGRRLGPKEIKTMADEERWVTEVVNRLKDHPALLAWYICDEFDETLEPRLRTMNERVHRLDPDHPTWICICDAALSGPLANAYDCVGLDPYPVANPYCGFDKPEWLPPERGYVTPAGDGAEVMRKSMDGMRPLWHVPQAFAWKWNFPKRPELRFPTRKELSNMTWQMVADGANGIVLYSYGEMFTYEPKSWQPYFKIACEVAQELKDRYETLIALPGPAAEDVPPTVRVRTWRLADGALAVLVVNRGNDPVKGTFRVPGKGEVAFDLAGLEVRWLQDDSSVTNLAAILRDMRADVKALKMKVGYPGKFLEIPESVKARRLQKYVTREVELRRDGEFFDVGEESVGYIEAESETRPLLFLGESKAEALNENEKDFEQTNEMVETQKGRWRTPLPLALRYFRFKGDAPKSVRFVEEIADVTDRVPFSGDAREMRIRAVALRTLRLCMRDFLIDGVKRDRLPWSGDLSVSLLANAYSYRDPEIVRRTLTVLDSAGWEAGDVNGIIDFSFWYVISHEKFQEHFGDLDYLKASYAKVAGRLESFAGRVGADGLIDRASLERHPTWLFIDWTDDAKSTTAVNMLHYGALLAGVKLANRVGAKADAARWTARAAALKARLHEKAWDGERGLFRFDVTDPAFGHFTRHANLYAAYFGVAEGGELESIGAALAADDLPAVGTPYANAYQVMALLKCGRAADARKLLERVWGGMLDAGATSFWEGYDEKERGDERWRFYGRPYAKSLCHAWGAAPLFLLPMLHLEVKP